MSNDFENIKTLFDSTVLALFFIENISIDDEDDLVYRFNDSNVEKVRVADENEDKEEITLKAHSVSFNVCDGPNRILRLVLWETYDEIPRVWKVEVQRLDGSSFDSIRGQEGDARLIEDEVAYFKETFDNNLVYSVDEQYLDAMHEEYFDSMYLAMKLAPIFDEYYHEVVKAKA